MIFNAVHCSRCANLLYRSKKRITESQKFGWKIYCSAICKKLEQTKSRLVTCTNPQCNKRFLRRTKQITKTITFYCSRSCAASVNNVYFPKRKAVKKICTFCFRTFTSNKQYCSKDCKNRKQIVGKDSIIKRIQQFYQVYERIPTKREFAQSRTAYCRFGSWNNAIIAAGFEPNPVLFAKKHLAKDGHKCDSFAEKIIDDWLYTKNISHERSVPYGYKNMSADFKINDVFLEFLGLIGVLKSYDKHLLQKKRLWKEQKLRVIKIYPSDLFPKNNLEKVFVNQKYLIF